MWHRNIEQRPTFRENSADDLKRNQKMVKTIRFLPFELAILSWNRKKLDFLAVLVFLGFLQFLAQNDGTA